jgi:hypothetical protein
MGDYKIIVDGLRAYGVECFSPRGFESVRGFATEVAAQAWIEQHINDANVGGARFRAELRRRSAAVLIRSTVARERAAAALERSIRCRMLAAEACRASRQLAS